MTLKYILKKIMWLTIFLVLCAIILPLLSYAWISFSTKAYLYDDVEQIPYREVGVVLGTSKYLVSGQQNLFYRTRIEAALELYHQGKVTYFIVSGSNPNEYYNEPKQMKADLVAGGVPADNIQPDYAGLRTLDSILRADKIFGNQSYTIISQPFHNARAVFIARHNGHDVVAFNASQDIALNLSPKTRVREYGARLKALIDIYLIDKQAKYYGDPIPFPDKDLDEI